MSWATLKDNPRFWEFAFIFAVILLIGAHKVSIEGMIE